MSSLPQPLVAYPNSIAAQPSHGPKNSFVPVFIVLGIIGALAVIACIVGQTCAHRYLRPRRRRDHAFNADEHMEEGLEMGIHMAKLSEQGEANGEFGHGAHGGLKGYALKHGEAGKSKPEGNLASTEA